MADTTDQDLIYIDVTEFTKNVQKDDTTHTVTGDGIFDTLMNTATQHLLAQYEANRLRGEDYATAYIDVYKTTLQAALQAWLQKGIADAQLELLKAQIEAEKGKQDLYRRQIEGFDEEFLYKVLRIMMDSWAVGFSVAKDSFEASGVPAVMQKLTIDDLYNQYIKTNLDKYTYKRTDRVLNGE